MTVSGAVLLVSAILAGAGTPEVVGAVFEALKAVNEAASNEFEDAAAGIRDDARAVLLAAVVTGGGSGWVVMTF